MPAASEVGGGGGGEEEEEEEARCQRRQPRFSMQQWPRPPRCPSFSFWRHCAPSLRLEPSPHRQIHRHCGNIDVILLLLLHHYRRRRNGNHIANNSHYDPSRHESKARRMRTPLRHLLTPKVRRRQSRINFITTKPINFRWCTTSTALRGTKESLDHYENSKEWWECLHMI